VITVNIDNMHGGGGELRVFGRKVLRIYGPTKEKDGTWWIKSNEELD